MKKLIGLTLLFTLFTLTHAQTSSFGINFKAYETKADFNKVVNAVPMGISLTYLRTLKDGPFSFGGEVGIAMYTDDEYEVNFQGRQVTIYEEDCFFTFHGFARYNLTESNWNKVYLEARLGATMFFSSAIAEETEVDYENNFDVHGTAFNSGLGAGVMIRPASVFDKENDYSSFWINLGANFMRGSEAQYRMAPQEPGIYTLDDGKHSSLTHYIGYRVGFVFDF